MARLTRAGLATPPWFVVTAEALPANLTREQRKAMAEATTPSALADVVSRISLSDAFIGELMAAAARLCPSGEPIVVRPSLNAADIASYGAACAQLRPLCVRREDLVDQLLDLWRSCYSEAVVTHRLRHRLDPCPQPPAVLVQRMLNPDASGIARGSDLTTGRRAISVVAAVAGLSTVLATGECSPDIFRLDPSGKVIDRQIGRKSVCHRPSPGGPEGFVARETPAAGRDAPVISNNEAVKIDALLGQVERLYERPQEIQWAIESGDVYLLGARPLQHLDRLVDPDAPIRYLDSSGFAELFPGPALPLTTSLLARLAPRAAHSFLVGMGVPSERIAARADAIDSVLATVNGQVYADMASWYRVLSALPDFPGNARFVGAMSGWRRRLPGALEASLGPAQGWRRRETQDGDRDKILAPDSYFLRKPITQYRSLKSLAGQVAKFQAVVAAAVKSLPESVARLRLDELVGCFKRFEENLLDVCGAPILLEYHLALAYGQLLDIVSRLWPGSRHTVMAGVLARSSGRWLPPAIGALQEIGMKVAADHAMIAVFECGSVDEIAAVLATRPALKDACAEFFARHGDASLGGAKLEANTLDENPLPFYRAIAHAALNLLEGEERERAKVDLPSRNDILAAHGLRRADSKRLATLADRTRSLLKDREGMFTDMRRVIGLLRTIFLEVGRRLYAIGAIEQPRDIFYLTIEELTGFADGSTITANLADLVATRQAYYRALRARPAPAASLDIHLPLPVGNVLEPSVDVAAVERRGSGVCAGYCRGEVVIAGMGRRMRTRGPIVLVARSADPLWPLLYPGVGAIVVEHGALLSGAAMEYRDQRIPAVVGIEGATLWLEEGDTVDVDGATGIVRKIAGHTHSASPHAAEAAEARV